MVLLFSPCLSFITHCSFIYLYLLISRPGMQLILPTFSSPALCSAKSVRPLVWHMLRINQCSWTPSLEMPRGELNMPKILMAKAFPLTSSRRRSSRLIPSPFSAFGLCYQSAISKRYGILFCFFFFFFTSFDHALTITLTD